MNINQKIITALSDLVDGNIWPLSKPVDEDPDIFIVFNPENEYLDYGDDRDLEVDTSMQIHWFAKGHADYTSPRIQIRDALRDAGFLLEPSPFIEYETEAGKSASGTGTGYTHMVIVARTDGDM